MIVLITVMMTISLFGCTSILPNMNEIDKLDLVRIAGVDIDPKNPDNIRVTILSKKSTAQSQGQGGQSGGAQSGSSQGEVVSNSAATLFEAERQLQTSSAKQLFWGHVDYYLISEKAARRGIGKYMDFFARDHETRDNANIYIIKGTTAEKFINKASKGDTFLPDLLTGIDANSILVTGPQEMTLMEFMEDIDNKGSAIVAPVLYLKSNKGEKKAQESVDLDGYAVFDQLKLVKFLDKKMTIAENFLLNQVKTSIIEVKDSHKKMIGLELINSSTKIAPYYENGELKGFNVKVKFTTNVDEVHSTSNIFTEEDLNFITNKQSEEVKNEIKKVISFAQKNKIDFLGVGKTFDTNHPVKWAKYKDKWKQIFPNLSFNVEVESKINRTYDIREPNGVLEEDHK